jgi:glutathione synthase/RimK-type ligase-like ATP-grasp enzyme
VRVALATAAHLPVLDEDGALLQAALADAGVAHEVCVWDDEGVDWPSYDLVVIRSTWDYWDRHEEFLAWTRRVPRLANSAEVVAWNTDKTYLARLAEAGVPVVPTEYVRSAEGWTPPAVPFVVKPTVSAGARRTAAYAAGDPAARAHVTDLLDAGLVPMVQPYVEAVDVAGETAVLVFDGEVSHAARKAALLTVGAGAGDGVDSRAFVSAAEASAEELAVTHQVLDVVRSWGHELLYARVDLLPGPVVVELEVTEPSLFLRHAPGSAERFAAAVRRWAQRAL